MRGNFGASGIATLLAILGCGYGVANAHVDSSATKPVAAPQGWFRVLKIATGTYEIAEPKYWQQNVNYLILGSRSAILFDTGPGIYNIRSVVKRITKLPLLVIPSHLHFDHVGGINEFSTIALINLPALRHEVRAGVFTETPAQFMVDTPFSFKVTKWLHDGEVLHLGGRRLTVLRTPGHTPDSVSLMDRAHHLLFTGDLVNRMVTLCDVPGSDIHEMANSIERLVRTAPDGSSAYEGHSENPITWDELKTLARGAKLIAEGRLPSQPICLGGVPMRKFEVGAFSFVLPSRSGEPLRPLSSVTQTLDWKGSACAVKR